MTTTVYKKPGIKPHLSIKRAELIWALAQQGYSDADIGNVFNITRQRVRAVRNEMPAGWQSPWIKIK